MELLIVMVIVSILAAIAIPSYAAYVRRGNRALAKSLISEILQKEEGFAIDHKQYTGTLSDLGYGTGAVFLHSDGNVSNVGTGALYTISLADGASTSCPPPIVAVDSTSVLVSVVAAPPAGSSQAADVCVTLCVNSNGVKGISAAATRFDECWGR